MPVRGIRGAITVDNNTPEDIVQETRVLLKEMIEKNHIRKEDVCSIFFSVTLDLTSEFPALAARQLGFTDTPLLCLTEIPVPESLGKVVRILIHCNTKTSQKDMIHVYLKEAVSLRPDLSADS
ncbi:MAG: chorismate mutase [Candidatus Aureabacteria bacterium]|nr:chorismate mutase [Candidatus Auribacterota bacterium]